MCSPFAPIKLSMPTAMKAACSECCTQFAIEQTWIICVLHESAVFCGKVVDLRASGEKFHVVVDVAMCSKHPRTLCPDNSQHGADVRETSFSLRE